MSLAKIIKHNGEAEEFDSKKLKSSLLRAGTNVTVANDIVKAIEKKLKNGDTTDMIYKNAFSMLKKREKQSAAMYSIRRSIFDLGPSGFPFEDFVAHIFQAKGYKTANNLMLQGKCTAHEVDLVAYNDEDCLITEVKFHNSLSTKSDTRVTLYVKARFDDLTSESFLLGGKKREMTRGILVTNTKFTNNARKYAKCVDTFDLISWDYPEKGNLYDLIFETGIQPLTCIPSLSKKEKSLLLEDGFVTCKSLKGQEKAMKKAGLSNSRIKEVVENIEMICSI